MRFIVYRVIRYRRDVVRENLRRSFPNKSADELLSIERKYYKHLCDMFVEVIHMLHVSAAKAQKMATFRNIDLINSYFDQGKSVVVAAGHYGNWEVLNTVSLLIKHKVIAAYKPVSNKHFEQFLNMNRERFGCVPICMYDIGRTTIRMSNNNEPFFLALFADQTPAGGEIRYWTDFLNQDTPVFLGTEKIARKTNQPVLFCKVYKPRRGYYEVEFEVITDNPSQTSPYQITQMHTKALENLISETPELWLWSHRRWKRQRQNSNPPNS